MVGFVKGYEDVDKEFPFQAVVHVCTHSVCVMTDSPAWGLEKYVKVAALGRCMIVHAWNKDCDLFRKSDLSGLFKDQRP